MARDPVHTVLVVDDVEAVRHLTRRCLELIGYQVVEAADGVAALAILAEQAVDLVITDMRMPRMDGWELVALLHQRSPLLPVVLMSAYDRRATSEMRPTTMLAKPFTPRALYDSIREALGDSGRTRLA